mmetsp:Transcript_27983/g.65238  ORF Transcript_27983/g.65238 Transcript_27983/m.65238 type:complete len:256 (+) Transcript_27983:537-1304(+)
MDVHSPRRLPRKVLAGGAAHHVPERAEVPERDPAEARAADAPKPPRGGHAGYARPALVHSVPPSSPAPVAPMVAPAVAVVPPPVVVPAPAVVVPPPAVVAPAPVVAAVVPEPPLPPKPPSPRPRPPRPRAGAPPSEGASPGPGPGAGAGAAAACKPTLAPRRAAHHPAPAPGSAGARSSPRAARSREALGALGPEDAGVAGGARRTTGAVGALLSGTAAACPELSVLYVDIALGGLEHVHRALHPSNLVLERMPL